MLRDCGRGEEAAGSSGYMPAARRLAPRDPTPEDRTLVSCSASAGGPSGPVGCRGAGVGVGGGLVQDARDEALEGPEGDLVRPQPRPPPLLVQRLSPPPRPPSSPPSASRRLARVQGRALRAGWCK